MGLITKEVEINLHPRIINHYENLHYILPKIKNKQGKIINNMNSKILVKVEDLPDGSNIKISVECDGCKKEIDNIIWQDYKNYVKDDGKYYCRNCALNLYGSKNANKTKLKNGKSFEQWCIENNYHNILNCWDYDLNNCKPSDIAYATNKKYYFKCPKEIHKSELKSISNFTNGQEGTIYCKACSSFAQWGVDNLGEDFLEKYWDYDNIESILQKELSEVVAI